MKALYRDLLEKANVKVDLDDTVPTNDQTEKLPFDFNYEIAPENVQVTDDSLGSGTFGKVILGYIKSTGTKVAIKSPLGKYGKSTLFW